MRIAGGELVGLVARQRLAGEVVDERDMARPPVGDVHTRQPPGGVVGVLGGEHLRLGAVGGGEKLSLIVRGVSLATCAPSLFN